MGAFQNVSRQEPCAICGKTDWCSVFLPDDVAYPGQKLYVCRRICQSEVTSPTNGKTYYFIKELSDYSNLYSDTKTEKSPCSGNYHFTVSHSSVNTTPAKMDTSIMPLPNKVLNSIYRAFLNELSLESYHKKKLCSDGWPEELILKSNIRSLHFPKQYDSKKGYLTDQKQRVMLCKRLLEAGHSLKGVPGFFQDNSGCWTFIGKSGMLFPIYDKYGYLYRLRLRLDHPDIDEKGKEKNKYKNFSSYYPSTIKNGVITNAFLNGCRAGSHVGIYFNPEIDDINFCIITEGEKKALVANFFLKCIVISLPGVNCFSKLHEPDNIGISVYDFLRNIGCKHIAIAYDADKLINNAVLQYEQKLVIQTKKEGFQTSIAQWNPGFGKGLDDILVLGVFPHYIPV